MKKFIIYTLVLCLCGFALLTACTDGDEQSTVSTPASNSSRPAANNSSSAGNSSDSGSMPDMSVDISQIIPNVSDMFENDSTVGEYSDGFLQESETSTK